MGRQQMMGRQVAPNLRALIVLVALVSAVGLIGAGCGGGDDSSSTTTGTEANSDKANASGKLEIKMGDYFFTPKDISMKGGKTVIETPNEGSVEHQLYVFKMTLDPAKLPTEADGDVDEEKLDFTAEQTGYIGSVKPGETESATVHLVPGKYVIFSNLPGDYAHGMYGTITVE